jgi:cell division protein ZapE
MLHDRVDLVELDTAIDYRHGLDGGMRTYFTPLGPVGSAAMNAAWRRETGGEPAAPVTLSIHGRRIRITQATDDAGRASFEELCENPLGTSDYLASPNASAPSSSTTSRNSSGRRTTRPSASSP